MNAVEIKDFNFKYANSGEKILENVNLCIKEGEAVALTGKSGTGKSTLCYAICGLIPKLYLGDISGSIHLFGKNIGEMSLSEIVSSVGIIFQNPSTQLFSPTIEDELAFGPENLCVERKEIGRRIDNILKIINMEEHRFENPNNLSGGQQQLIAIASTLMLNPKIIICDEIMSWIDDEGKEVIKRLLLNLKSEGRTIIIIDHEKENIKFTDRIIQIGVE